MLPTPLRRSSRPQRRARNRQSPWTAGKRVRKWVRCVKRKRFLCLGCGRKLGSFHNLDVIPNHARCAQVEYAISNSFAFGGLNAVLALRAAG